MITFRWSDIRNTYPNKFILMGDIVEERLTDSKFKILGGRVIQVSDNPKEIRKAYQEYNKKGVNVIYSLPNTPVDFIVENVYLVGAL